MYCGVQQRPTWNRVAIKIRGLAAPGESYYPVMLRFRFAFSILLKLAFCQVKFTPEAVYLTVIINKTHKSSLKCVLRTGRPASLAAP